MPGFGSTVDIWDSVVQTLNREVAAEEKSFVPFHEWVTTSSIIVDGLPFSFKRHEYLVDVYKDDHPFIVDMKSAQMGLTTRAALKVIHNARYRGFRGELYLFPSRTDVSDFSKGRLDPMIDDNPDTIGQWVRDTDATNIKRIWNCFLYLRGMRSRVGLKSVPADFIVYDELDEALQNAVDMADERMSHSQHKEKLMLSNPTLPDFGIDKQFSLSDEKYWLLKCPHCNQYNNLVEDFPKCILRVNGRAIRACRKCHGELDPSIGQWVAKKPMVKDRSGRQYSQLYSQYITPEEILYKQKTKNATDFHNLVIGVAYIEAQNRLSVEEVLDLCSEDGIASSDKAPCFMGVDQKGNALHVVIGKDWEGKAGKIIHINIYGTGKTEDWNELDSLMRNFNVTRAVVDALPDQRGARAFAERFKGRVFLNFYSDSQRGGYKWDEEKLQVNCNRTESLDASHNEIKMATIVLPKKCEIVETFATHLHNIGKRLIEDEETGSKRYIYVRLGEDHFRHAYNYFMMGLQHASGLIFPELL